NRKYLKQSHKNEDRTECYYVKKETVEQEGSSKPNDKTSSSYKILPNNEL
ncbi:30463_t:CDS:1, partial [Racocetra persica]